MSKMLERILIIFCALIVCANCQIPGFGRCPEFQAMQDFKRDRFLGQWFEAERYFSVSEVAAKCIAATYSRRADGKIYVDNFYMNRINNVQRIISGKFSMVGKGKEGRFTVRYETFPANYDTQLVVLDTDYESYAVMWSCSDLGGIGHTQSAWVMTRERIPPGPVLQSAYGVLDKFKMSRSYFVTTDQTDCITLAPPLEAIDPTERSISKNLDDLFFTGEKKAEDKKPEVLDETVPDKVIVKGSFFK